MRRLFAAADLPPSERKEQQTLIAVVFTAGVLTIAARLVPDAFDFSAAHSPNAYRMLRIAAALLRPLRALALLDDPARKWIRLQCLAAVLGQPQRLRGMQQALQAPAFQAYMTQLDAGFRLFRQKVRAPN